MATAAVAVAMRKVTSHLMSNNAVSAEGAVPNVPGPASPAPHARAAGAARVIVETAPDRYFIDIPAYDRWRRRLRRRVALLLGGVVLAGLGAALLA